MTASTPPLEGAGPVKKSRGLLRVLGAAFGLAIVVGSTVGGGILRTPGDVAAQLPHVGAFMAIWVFGALNSFLGATMFSEMGAMTPRSGGYYAFAKRALGSSMGFFVGFTDWLNWSVGSAALTLLIGEYLGPLIPFLNGRPALAGFLTLAMIAALQFRGVKWGGRTQEITSVLKVLALLILVVAAFTVPAAADTAPGARSLPTGVALMAAVAIAMQGVIFTYDSYYAVVYCGEELKDPGRDIPRSMFRGLLVISGVFLLINLVFVLVVPMDRMAGDPFVGATVARMIFGERGDVVIRLIMIVSLIGTINAQIMAAPRILHAMSEDGLFPRQALQVTRGGTPGVATLLSFAVISAFVFSGSFSTVLAVDTIIIVLLYVMMFSSFFVLRKKEPLANRPYRAWGYPVVQIVTLVLAVIILGSLVYADVRSALITLGLLALCWPVSRIVERLVRVT